MNVKHGPRSRSRASKTTRRKGVIHLGRENKEWDSCNAHNIYGRSLLQVRVADPRLDEKEDVSTEWKVPKNTPVNDPKAVEQTDPPRCAMQGPICGGPPS